MSYCGPTARLATSGAKQLMHAVSSPVAAEVTQHENLLRSADGSRIFKSSDMLTVERYTTRSVPYPKIGWDEAVARDYFAYCICYLPVLSIDMSLG